MSAKLAYFNKKLDAIDHLKKNDDTFKQYLFQLDRENGKKGTKQFMVGSFDEIWNLLKSGKNSIYESWEDKPIHFALDIDYPSDQICYNDLVIHVKQIITGIIMAVNCIDYQINIQNIVVLENQNQDKNQVQKYSFHIIFRGLVMENYIAACKFFESLEGINLEGCDKSIYRKTCFRTCFSTKINKNQVLVPKVLEIGKKKTDNEDNYDSLKEFWVNTLIVNTETYDIVYKNDTYIDTNFENNVDSNLKPVDIPHLEKIIMQLPNKYYDEYMYWSKIGMILRNSPGDQEQLFEVFNKFSQKSVTKYPGKPELLKHWKTFKDNRKNKITVGTLFLWCKEEKISFATTKTLDNMIDEYPERKLELSHEHKVINQRYFSIDEIHNAWTNKLIGIQSEKGTGKTTALFKYLFDNKILEKNDSVLFISSRRTFGIKLLGDIQKFGFKLYSEMKESQINHDKMICQIDSILRLTNDKFKYIIVDEAESLMRYLTSSHFTKNIKSSLVVSNFETRIAEAEKVIIMDADLSNRSFDYFQNIMELDSKDIKLIVNKFQAYSDYTIEYMTYSTWLKLLMDTLDKKKKIVIPTASNNQAKDLKLLIHNHYPELKVLLIHRETADNEKLDQVINVNDRWSNYDIVIYTPSVCMGISFDDEYFDNIFAYGCENSLGSQEFCQMLHRVRKPKEKVIYITLDRFVEYEKDRHELELNKIETIVCYDYYLTHFNLHNNLITKKYKANTKKDKISVITKDNELDNTIWNLFQGSGGNIVILDEEETNIINQETEFIEEKKFTYPYKNEPIYKVYLKNAHELISDRLNFGNQLFGYFKLKGYQLKKHEWEDGEMIKNEIKEIRELRKEEETNKEIEGIFNSPEITDEEYKEIMNKRKEDITQDEIYKLQKRNFKKCYVLDDINKEILSTYKDITVMKHYHNLSIILPDEKEGIDTKLENIRQDRVNNSYIGNAYADLTIKNSYPKHMWANKILTTLGFSLIDLDIRISSNIIEDIINNDLIKDIETNLEYFVHKFNLSFPKKKLNEMELKDKIKFMSKIIEAQYGLTILKDSGKNYYISDNNTWNELYEYRTKKPSTGIKLKDKIIKKEKNHINIDQCWFEE
jgi:hypothetical protein